MSEIFRIDNGYCDYSFLRVQSCGHCLGITLDPELEDVVKENMR